MGVPAPLGAGKAKVAGFVVEGAGMGRSEKVVYRSGTPLFFVEGKAIEDVLLGVEGGEHFRFERLLFGTEPLRMVGCVRDEPGGDEMAGSRVIEGRLLPTLLHCDLASEGASVVIGMAAFVSVSENGVNTIQATGDLLGDQRQVSRGFLIQNGQHLALRFGDTGERYGT